MIGILTVLALALTGAGMIVGGAYVLAGEGIALITSGVLFLIAAKIISRGLNG